MEIRTHPFRGHNTMLFRIGFMIGQAPLGFLCST